MEGQNETLAVRTSGAGDRIQVEVADSGCGIPDSRIPHLFDPFFTTKTDGQGTGLGLWVCRRVIQEHGGRISIETREGQGTSVHVSVPVRMSRP